MKIIRADSLQYIPASHEDAKSPGVFKRILAVKDNLFKGRVQMINWTKLPVGSSFRKHYHENMEEVFVIIQGSVEVDVDGCLSTLTQGDAIIISPGEVHTMKNNSQIEVLYIVVGIAGDENGKTIVLP